MIQKLRNMIKQGFVTLTGGDSDAYPVGQVTVNKKPSKYVKLSVYGVCSNPPVDSHVLLLSSQGMESTKFGIVNDFLNRKKNLKEGEAALFNTKTGAFVLMKEDGSVHVSGLTKLDVDADLNVDGDITATGDISAKGDVVADSAGLAISLIDHYHIGNLGRQTTPSQMTGGSPLPASAPSMNSDGEIIDGNGTNSTEHGHPYTWTDPGGSGTTGDAV